MLGDFQWLCGHHHFWNWGEGRTRKHQEPTAGVSPACSLYTTANVAYDPWHSIIQHRQQTRSHSLNCSQSKAPCRGGMLRRTGQHYGSWWIRCAPSSGALWFVWSTANRAILCWCCKQQQPSGGLYVDGRFIKWTLKPCSILLIGSQGVMVSNFLMVCNNKMVCFLRVLLKEGS